MAYLQRVGEIVERFKQKGIPICIVQIPRSNNSQADSLSKIASLKEWFLPGHILNETLFSPSVNIDFLSINGASSSVKSNSETYFLEENPYWIDLIVEYLQIGRLLLDKERH